MQTVSKSQLKSQLLEYLRKVEKDKKPLIVTHAGKPVVKITPFDQDSKAVLKSLRGSVLRYDDPNEPVGLEDWKALK
ncbi:type II toxin-antitoxin system Phd/YefM family antitoxin [Candidatus Curtissbacteria bacterium]|nr:type II toxin-antitoxin system Phd/YefM family antitoxin [Candidatus Curtissbacteria bacterium]